MTRSLAKSNAQFQKAIRRLPLGVSSNFRYWGADKTIYVKSAKGARLTDVDGNEYIDYRLAYGPCILGYADPRVDAAARAGIEVGGVFALSTERECAVAERIAGMVPAAELVRFSNSGTEAVMAALRVARAYTGKDSYVVIEGGYHGVFDAALWTTAVEEWSPGHGDPQLVPYSAGVPHVLRALIHAVPMNDAERLEAVFKAYGGDIAAFLIEPIMGNCCSISATREFLKDARALCDKYGILLVIDEVKTGFRVARGGVQELFGVKADICTFAKAMANGYPISVCCGREDIMRRFGDGARRGREDAGDPGRDPGARERRRLRDEAPLRHEPDPVAARHQALLQRSSIDERPVLQREASARLPRLGHERLHFLRSTGAAAA
jgi:glutamate-1-semialdehyde 2,1-aminomutase